MFEHVSPRYLGRAPAEVREKIAVLERTDDTVVAEHRTPLPWLDAITVERVRFLPPDRITFRLADLSWLGDGGAAASWRSPATHRRRHAQGPGRRRGLGS